MTPALNREAPTELRGAVARVAIRALAIENGTAEVHGEEIEALLSRAREADGYVASIAEADALAVALRTGRDAP